MNEKNVEEFNEKFATVEAALQYVADSQAKSEFIHKRDNIAFSKKMAEIAKRQEKTQQLIEQNERQIQRHLDETQRQIDKTQRQLNHITLVLRFNIEEYEFQEENSKQRGKF